MQRNLDSRSEPRDHAFAVERNDLHLAIRKVLGQKAATGPKYLLCVRDVQVNLLNADFQRISRLRFFDVPRPIQDVAAGTFVYDMIENIAQVLLYRIGRQAGFLETR